MLASRQTRSPADDRPAASEPPGTSAARTGCIAAGWVHVFLVAVLLVAFVVSALTSLLGDSCTFDEPAHVRIGLAALVYREYEPAVVSHRPPLAAMWSVLPLVCSRDVELPRAFHELDGVRVLWQHGDGHALLVRCRLMTLLLAVGLAGLVYRFARELGGRWPGVLALALYVFCPNIVAHARLVGDDLAAAAGLTAATYALWRWYERPSRGRLVCAGLGTGLALCLKHVGVFVLPAAAVLCWLDARRSCGAAAMPPPARPVLVQTLRAVLTMYATAALVLWAAYGLEVQFRDLIPVPVPSYWQGWSHLFRHAASGHAAYLAGRLSQHGWWYYYFVAMALKTPLGLLGLIALSMLGSGQLLRRRPVAALVLILPAVLILAASTRSGQNIGLRHVLPVYPPMFIWVSQLAAADLRFFARRSLIVLLAVCHAVAGLSAWPDYLPYFNSLAGGPRGGHRWLLDSNLDWGQGLIALRQWMQGHDVSEIQLEYFGTVRPDAYGIRWRPLEPGATGWVAISASRLAGIGLADPDRFAWLRELVPVDHAGYSILIYRVEPKRTKACGSV
jgi:hypothetical protein